MEASFIPTSRTLQPFDPFPPNLVWLLKIALQRSEASTSYQGASINCGSLKKIISNRKHHKINLFTQFMDSPWQEMDVSVLQKAISSNHTEFGRKESNGCRILEVGINEASILMIRYRQPKISLGSSLTTSLRLFQSKFGNFQNIRCLRIWKKSLLARWLICRVQYFSWKQSKDGPLGLHTQISNNGMPERETKILVPSFCPGFQLTQVALGSEVHIFFLATINTKLLKKS